ncbi:unnamed protein product, partial [Leptidea sinapis]
MRDGEDMRREHSVTSDLIYLLIIILMMMILVCMVLLARPPGKPGGEVASDPTFYRRRRRSKPHLPCKAYLGRIAVRSPLGSSGVEYRRPERNVSWSAGGVRIHTPMLEPLADNSNRRQFGMG